MALHYGREIRNVAEKYSLDGDYLYLYDYIQFGSGLLSSNLITYPFTINSTNVFSNQLLPNWIPLTWPGR